MRNPYQPISREKAEKIAQRKNEKAAKAAPLFADQLPPVTPEMVEEAFRKQHEKFEECLTMLAQRAEKFRSLAAGVLPAEEIAKLDERRKCLPDSPEFSADFWRRVLREIGQDPPRE